MPVLKRDRKKVHKPKRVPEEPVRYRRMSIKKTKK